MNNEEYQQELSGWFKKNINFIEGVYGTKKYVAIGKKPAGEIKIIAGNKSKKVLEDTLEGMQRNLDDFFITSVEEYN